MSGIDWIAAALEAEVSAIGTPPPESIAATVEALAAPTDLHRANARRIIAEQRLETLRDALRERAKAWRADASRLESAARWAAESTLRTQARGLRDRADELEALLAAQAGDESGEAE